eukprot:874859_1
MAFRPSSSRKRSRIQFESNDNNNNNDNDNFGIAPKRTKISTKPLYNNINNSITNNNNNENISHNNTSNHKQRGFQTHANKLQENGIKTRQETILQNRKLKRKFILQQNHNNALKVRMNQPNFWKFNFEFQTHINNNYNNNNNNYNKDSSIDSL